METVATQPPPMQGELEDAIRQRNDVAVEALLQRGADPNKESYNVLSWVADTGDVKLVRLLIDHGANINRKDEYDGKTALMAAVEGGSAEAVRLLVDRGADINIKNTDGLTAQNMAKNLKDRAEIIQLLKEAPMRRYHATALEKQQRLNARARPIIRRLQP